MNSNGIRSLYLWIIRSWNAEFIQLWLVVVVLVMVVVVIMREPVGYFFQKWAKS